MSPAKSSRKDKDKDKDKSEGKLLITYKSMLLEFSKLQSVGLRTDLISLLEIEILIDASAAIEYLSVCM